MTNWVLVQLYCNDPYNGNFDHCVRGIAVGVGDGDSLELEPVGLQGGYRLTHHECRFRLHRRWYKRHSTIPGGGNWSWDAYWMDGQEARRLLVDVKKSGFWTCSSGPEDFFEWFNGPADKPLPAGFTFS